MKYTLLIVLFTLFSFQESHAQNEIDIRKDAYILGKQYYSNKDYLTAYKYLIAYKFAFFDQLTKSENSSSLNSLNKVLAFCESQLKKGLSGSNSWEGSGWSDVEMEKVKKVTKDLPPSLPDIKF